MAANISMMLHGPEPNFHIEAPFPIHCVPHAGVVGAFYWTLRMGSGWDPRPTEQYPKGRQIEGTSAWQSLPDYPFRVWSYLEMIVEGIAIPLNSTVTGLCP